jgi:hypothetical protein
MNMIIGKRQIILAALVVGLGIAVYLNWQYTNQTFELPVTDMLERMDGGANYGEAQYVDSQQSISELEADLREPDFSEADNESFFVEAKLSRQKARDEAVETLAVMLSDAALSAEQKTDLARRATDLANSIEVEGKIENLIKAKGYTDVMVYYDAARADIMVRTAGLMAEDVVKIKDIVLKETDIPAENIAIIEIN